MSLASSRFLRRSVPAIFVLLWSTGFIGAKLGTPYAEPIVFLTLRYAIAAGLLGVIALASGAPWPRRPREWLHIAVVGVLVHAVYLGGVFAAVDRGFPAGFAALIVSLQPLVVALAAGPLLGERIAPRQWLGFLLGLIGVVLVLAEKLDPGAVLAFQGFDRWAVLVCVLSLVAIAAGTLYQKRFGQNMDLRSGTTIQYIAAFAVSLPVALAFESLAIDWTPRFIFAMTWLVLVLSIGAVSLLMLLIRLGEASKVSSLFYLVPPSTAVIAYFLFDERLGVQALVGMAIAALGVALAVRAPARG